MKLAEALLERTTRNAVRDPALAKLLADLPDGDPDAPQPDMAEIWLPFCEGRHRIPVGQPADVNFGLWRGPTMRTEDVIIHAVNLRTGHEGAIRIGDLRWSGPAYADYGTRVEVRHFTLHV